MTLRFKLTIVAYFTMVSDLFATSITSKGGSSQGIFSKAGILLQQMVDFMEGPLAVAAIIGGLVLAAVTWAYAPDNRHLGTAARVAAAGFFVFSISTLIMQF
jgi:type IV secretory pathway VirB2 component (pilin)